MQEEGSRLKFWAVVAQMKIDGHVVSHVHCLWRPLTVGFASGLMCSQFAYQQSFGVFVGTDVDIDNPIDLSLLYSTLPCRPVTPVPSRPSSPP